MQSPGSQAPAAELLDPRCAPSATPLQASQLHRAGQRLTEETPEVKSEFVGLEVTLRLVSCSRQDNLQVLDVPDAARPHIEDPQAHQIIGVSSSKVEGLAAVSRAIGGLNNESCSTALDEGAQEPVCSRCGACEVLRYRVTVLGCQPKGMPESTN